ncbi:MAG: hypothetical protein KAR07_12570 [Spirochaetes bacterium]|nr:hypothetical protein [Spirochaetota bacterium]
MYNSFMKALLIIFLLFPVSLLSQDFLRNDPKSQTNLVSIKELDNLFRFSFTLSTIAMEDSYTNFSNTNKDPLNNFTSLKLTYEMAIYKNHTITGTLFKEDSYGLGMSLHYIYRSIDGLTKRKTDWGSLIFGFGILTLNNTKLHNSPKLLFSWFFKMGSPMSTYASIEADGFGLIPWEPGFLVSDNNRFKLEGQLRLGFFGLYAGFSRFVVDDEGDPGILQHHNTSLRSGIAFFSQMNWRLLFYFSAQKKKLVNYTKTTEGYTQTDSFAGELSAAGIEFTSQYRSDTGELRRYTWGFEISFDQYYRDVAGSGFQNSSDNTEFKFTWSSTFAL